MILITGNLGYIGVVLTDYLKKRDYKIVGLDTGWFNNSRLSDITCLPNEQIVKDIRKVNPTDFRGIDVVVHLAALSNDPLGEINPQLTVNINAQATINLAKVAKKCGVNKFIFASSCSVYGKAETTKPVTEMDVVGPLTSYAKAKLLAENGLMELASNNFHPVMMRNATVYGSSPTIRLDLVVNNLIAGALINKKVTILSDGTPWRPLVHIRDLAQAIETIICSPEELVHNQIFNVGRIDGNYQVKEIGEKVCAQIKNSRLEILGQTGGDERSYKVNFCKFNQTFKGFKPRWTLTKGIKEIQKDLKRKNFDHIDWENKKYIRLEQLKKLMSEGAVDDQLINI
ncbi:MAG: NAD-dependent epimerase/dehydratase [uncultured bacterium]|nr:MAG: NAD-dependent epimerase/dehydratase [uncultured bacterium]